VTEFHLETSLDGHPYCIKLTIMVTFRERLSKSGVMDEGWSSFNEMIDNYGLKSGREYESRNAYFPNKIQVIKKKLATRIRSKNDS
jgi:hypothetical protein